jgi:hypothetical protein
MKNKKLTKQYIKDNAVLIVEGVIKCDLNALIKAWLHLVNTGLAWQLQGAIGRTAQHVFIDTEIFKPMEKISVISNSPYGGKNVTPMYEIDWSKLDEINLEAEYV